VTNSISDKGNFKPFAYLKISENLCNIGEYNQALQVTLKIPDTKPA